VDAPDIARIRYVTRHYASLRGLWLVAACVPCFGLLALAPFLDTDRGVRILQMLIFWVAVIFFQQWSMFRVRDYYASRFGKVTDDDYAERSLPWLALFGVAFVADFLRFQNGGRSGVFLVVAALGLWRSARGWPWRAHQLGLAVVAAGAFIALHLPGPGGNVDRFIVLASLLLCGTAIVCALLDHRLLVRTLRPAGRLVEGAR
jgi:hypothetical protein